MPCSTAAMRSPSCRPGCAGPKITILGADLAGTVVATGKSVTRFAPGDQVLGSRGEKFGGYAELACVSENGFLAKKPVNMTMEEAASVFVGAVCSLFFLRKANIRPGEGVLVHGASGSLGTFAVQLAKHHGAHMTAVCGTGNVELVRSLGADAVMDYKRQDFTRDGPSYDRLQAAYPQVADLYELAVRDEHGQLRLHWQLIEDRRTWRDAREGRLSSAHESHRADRRGTLDEVRQLTEAEAAFRTLKSELAIRPLFHRVEHRVKAHVRVSRLRALDHVETSARPAADGPHASARPRTPRDPADGGHRAPHDRRTRDSPPPRPPHRQAHDPTTAAPRPPRHPHSAPPRMERGM